MTTLNVEEGYIAFPKRLSLAIAVGIIAAFVMQAGAVSWHASKLDSRVSDLEAGDRRILDRGDERYIHVVKRLDKLEGERDRIVRVEEHVKLVVELVREIRADMRPQRRASAGPD